MAKKKKILIILAVIFGAVLIAIGIVAGVILANLNDIAKKATVKALSYVLQVEVNLNKFEISLLGGSCTLEGLVIGNPEGYKTKEAFSMDRIDVSVNIKSFRTDEPVIKVVSIKNPKITLEQGFKKSNLSQLIKNASRFEGKEEKKAEPSPREAEKKIRIDKILLSGARVSLSAPVLQGEALTIPLPTIEMKDIGGKGNPVTIGKAIKIFLSQVVTETLKAGKDIIPSDLDKMLQTSFRDALNIDTSALKKTADDLGENVKEGVKGIQDSVKGIFQKDK